MSAQLSTADRPDFGSGDWFAGTADDYAAEATSYIAYSGPFHVDEEKQTLTHSMFVSLFPNWTGQTQPRRVKLEDDRLHLGTASPIRSSGKTVNSVLIWRRAEPNCSRTACRGTRARHPGTRRCRLRCLAVRRRSHRAR